MKSGYIKAGKKMSKTTEKLNRFFAMIIILSLFLVFTQKIVLYNRSVFNSISEGIMHRERTGESFVIKTYDFYIGVHKAVKEGIEWLFYTPPMSTYFDRAHYIYIRATNRNHFNGVTFLTDGRLMLDDKDYNAYLYERADAIVKLQGYTYERGIPFLYVRIPSKLQDNSLLPRAFSENSIIANGDALLRTLKDNDVKTFDLREEMEKDGVDFATAFFRGDHHWTAETALWAYSKIGVYINGEYGLGLDERTWDPQQYERVAFEGTFLRTEVEAVSAIGIPEDINALIPRFPAEFNVTSNWSESYRYEVASGSFAEVFTPELLKGQSSAFNYMEGLNAVHDGFNRYDNILVNNGKKVLIIADSMGISIATYFATAFESVDFLYLRNGQNERAWSAIDRYDYDLVIFAVSDVVISQGNEPTFENDRLYLGEPPGR